MNKNQHFVTSMSCICVVYVSNERIPWKAAKRPPDNNASVPRSQTKWCSEKISLGNCWLGYISTENRLMQNMQTKTLEEESSTNLWLAKKTVNFRWRHFKMPRNAAGWLVGWLAGNWLAAAWLAGWLAGCCMAAGWLACWLAGCWLAAGCLAGCWLAGCWLSGWLLAVWLAGKGNDKPRGGKER